MTTDTDALLATVREALERDAANLRGESLPHARGSGLALAALDSLAAELERLRLEVELRQACAISFSSKDAGIFGLIQIRDSLTAELERVKAERDRHIERADKLLEGYVKTQEQAAELLPRLDKALSALREIDQPNSQSAAYMRHVARTALAEIEGEA